MTTTHSNKQPDRPKKDERHLDKPPKKKSQFFKSSFWQWIKKFGEPIAFATILLAVATFFLYLEATKQGRTSRKALDVTLENYRSENQPLFGLTNIKFDSLKVGQPLRVYYNIVNWGRSPAFITDHYFALRSLPRVNVSNLSMSYDGHTALYRYSYSDVVHQTLGAATYSVISQGEYDSIQTGLRDLYFAAPFCIRIQ